MSKAISKYVRLSPKRARLVADLVRGKNVPYAKAVLANTNTKASRLILKTLNSAIANAETQKNLRSENLVLKTLLVDEASKLKRFKSANKGRSSAILKPTVHLFVEVDERKNEGAEKR